MLMFRASKQQKMKTETKKKSHHWFQLISADIDGEIFSMTMLLG